MRGFVPTWAHDCALSIVQAAMLSSAGVNMTTSYSNQRVAYKLIEDVLQPVLACEHYKKHGDVALLLAGPTIGCACAMRLRQGTPRSKVDANYADEHAINVASVKAGDPCIRR